MRQADTVYTTIEIGASSSTPFLRFITTYLTDRFRRMDQAKQQQAMDGYKTSGCPVSFQQQQQAWRELSSHDPSVALPTCLLALDTDTNGDCVLSWIFSEQELFDRTVRLIQSKEKVSTLQGAEREYQIIAEIASYRQAMDELRTDSPDARGSLILIADAMMELSDDFFDATMLDWGVEDLPLVASDEQTLVRRRYLRDHSASIISNGSLSPLIRGFLDRGEMEPEAE